MASCNEAKKAKLENGKTNDDTMTQNVCGNIHEELNNLGDFQDIKVINNDTHRKTVCLEGTFAGKDGKGVVILEKTAFTDSDLTTDKFFVANCVLKKSFTNDIYGNYNFYPEPETNAIKTTIIHPATEKHIVKYAQQNLYIIDESPEIYNTITLPELEKEQFTLDWVYNILEGKAEADRVVCQDLDPEIGFTLVPDLKWDGTKETLYLLAIVRKHNIKSIRDLTAEHLPLLKNIFNKGCELIKEKYDLDKSQLRIYFHYQPSFYHLHIHFTYLKHDAPGIYTEKAHLLSNVISNLEILSDYYKKITIPFVVKENDNLFKIYESKKLIKKIE